MKNGLWLLFSPLHFRFVSDTYMTAFYEEIFLCVHNLEK
jgi:hypothetical protein